MNDKNKWKKVKEQLSMSNLGDEMDIWMQWNTEAKNITSMNSAIEEWLD